MSRKHIVALAAAVILAVSIGVLVSKAFDRHDTRPFPVDPEVPTFLIGSLLGTCIGTVALTVQLLGFFQIRLERLWIRVLRPSPSLKTCWQAFEHERLLFSPPPCVSSLRI
ncbi:MAG: hypothetical protein HIU91_11325 [Acidobacteria bacterium]|nr:hypothetical protein [Acidobacteriota bacterium]